MFGKAGIPPLPIAVDRFAPGQKLESAKDFSLSRLGVSGLCAWRLLEAVRIRLL